MENYKLNLYLLKDKKVHKISCSEAADKKIVSGKIIAYYLARVQQLYEKYGFQNEKLRFRELEEEARAFYAKETWDFEIQTSDEDWVEISACNYRTDYDMKRHGEFSKKDFSIKEEGDVEKFIPHIFEISTGIDRTFYLVLDNAFRKEKRGPEERIFLDLNPKISPYIAGIFPLMKKDGLYEKAHEIWEELRSWNLDVFFDEKGSIGKRYARIDEIGVPFGITVDYDTLKDGTVTLRDRNSLEQKRVKITELQKLLQELELGKTRF
ncbi:MAG: His/Gly/Thr/Pro-type tRNA ligase C-terminal domain-containing protein [Candidatus Diapherotrites archaeon]|nr:His/Gly/Thr/Pro-type tRNA ligase C-terminal domain-containing protein [Candidatus Diapherotrites archaeon]